MKELTGEIIVTLAVAAVLAAVAYIVLDNRSDLKQMREEVRSQELKAIRSTSNEKAIRALQEEVRELQLDLNVHSNA